MRNQTISISDPADLHRAVNASRQVRLILAESLPIDTGERVSWERRLNRDLHACGCPEAAFGLLAGIAISVTWICFATVPWGPWKYAVALVFPILPLILGKLIGRWFGKLRYRRLCNELRSRLVEGTGNKELRHAVMS